MLSGVPLFLHGSDLGIHFDGDLDQLLDRQRLFPRRQAIPVEVNQIARNAKVMARYKGTLPSWALRGGENTRGYCSVARRQTRNTLPPTFGGEMS